LFAKPFINLFFGRFYEMIVTLLANGFEEIEALTPVDVLRRAGLDVKTCSIGEREVIGAHGIRVLADLTKDELDISKVNMLILPGGMPGATNLDASPLTDALINEVTSKGGRLAAICAAPLVLGRRGLLKGKRATCYPGFEDELLGATATGEGVVTDKNITTAKGMGVALEFAHELVRLTLGEKKAAEISASIMEK
jgi:4-methyl-5(b-hydroxyethyl)-thiazole monophosphate biosynthesis